MAAFITNFQSPFELDDLQDRFERDGLTNIDYLLHFDESIGEWTVHKDAQVGDRVYFMCAVTSKDHMGHVCAQARAEAPEELQAFAEEQRKLYKKYAGRIVAVGKVDEPPFQSIDSGYAHAPWRNPWYARICDVQLLGQPIPYDDFRDFITVNSTGSITKLTGEQEEALETLIAQAEPGEPKQGLKLVYGAITRFAGALGPNPGMWGEGGTTFEPSEVTLAFAQAFRENRQFRLEGYERMFQDVGLDLANTIPTPEDLAGAPVVVYQGILTYAVDALESNPVRYGALAKSGLLDGCLYQLEAEDQRILREERMPEALIHLAEGVLRLLADMPEGKELTIDRCVAATCILDSAEAKTNEFEGMAIDVPELMDVDFLVYRHAPEFGIWLDYSEHAGQALGLPFVIPFRVRHL